MNKLLSAAVCIALVSSFSPISAEEKSISPHSEQAITIPDSLDGYTLTMTSKELNRFNISYYTLDLDNGAIVKNGEIGNYYEENKNNKSRGAHTCNPLYNATIIFSKNQWTQEQSSGIYTYGKGKSSGIYTCEKIGKSRLSIELIEVLKNGDFSPVRPRLFLYFKTSDTGNAYFLEEESVGGNISFMLKKSSGKQ